MNWFSNVVTAWAPRLLGAGAAFAANKIATVTGIVVDPAALQALAIAAYSGTHRLVSAKTNPGDAANGRVIDAEKAAAKYGSTVVVASKS